MDITWEMVEVRILIIYQHDDQTWRWEVWLNCLVDSY